MKKLPKPTKAIDALYSYWSDSDNPDLIIAETPSRYRHLDKGNIVLVGMEIGRVIGKEFLPNTKGHRVKIQILGKMPFKSWLKLTKNFRGKIVKGGRL